MSRRLTIFVEGHVFDSGHEGVSTVIRGLYSALVHEYPGEFRIVIGCHQPDRVSQHFSGLLDIEFHRYQSVSKYVRLTKDIPDICHALRPDFAHFQYFTPIIKSCPWIVTIHDILFNDFPAYFPFSYRLIRNCLFRVSAWRADLLTTVSDYAAESLAHHYRIQRQRIHVIENGVDTPMKSEMAALPPPFGALLSKDSYFLCVSRHEPRKNQIALLLAWQTLNLWEQGIHLVFVGSRTLPVAAFEDAYAQLPMIAQPLVHFLTGVGDAELATLYRGARLAIYPSLAEGFGLPPLESALRGIPTLCSNTTAMADFHWFGRYHCDPSPDALAEKVAWVLEHENEARRDFGRMALDLQDKYAWRHSARKFREMIMNSV